MYLRKSLMLRTLALGAILGLVATLTGCSEVSTTSPPNDEVASRSLVGLAASTTSGGARLWVRLPSTDGLDALIEGTLRWNEGGACFLLEGNGQFYGVVWPNGTTADAASAVVTSDGDAIQVGDDIVGAGGYLDVAEGLGIPADCAPTAGEVAVFNADATLTSRG